jgi:hypothetical protein
MAWETFAQTGTMPHIDLQLLAWIDVGECRETDPDSKQRFPDANPNKSW